MQQGPPPLLSLRSTVFEQLPIPLMVFDAGGVLCDINPAARQISLLAHYLPGVTCMAMLPEPLRSLVAQCQQGESVNTRIRLDSGETQRIFSCTATPLIDSGGTLLQIQVATEATALDRAEVDALAASEERLRLALDATGASVWEADLQTNRLTYSDQWRTALGYTDDEIAAMEEFPWSVIHPDDLPGVRAEVLAYLEGRTPVFVHELRLRTRAGSYRCFVGSGRVAAWSADGRPLRMVGTNIEITERKQMEEALRASEERFRLLLANTQDMIWIVDLQGRFTYVSPSVERQLGYAPAELIGQTFDASLSPAAAANARMQMAAIVPRLLSGSSPEELSFEAEHLRKDGTSFYTQTLGVPLLDTDGRLCGFQGVSRDINELKRTEAALRASLARLHQSEANYRTLIETLDIAVCRWLPDTTLLFANEKYRTAFGLGDAIAGRKWLEFVPEATRATTAAFYTELAAAPRRITYEHPVSEEDGSIHYYHWIDTPIPAPDDTLSEFLSVGLDISARRSLEVQLAEKQKILEAVTEMIPDMVYLYHLRERRQVYFNRELGDLLGYTSTEMIDEGKDAFIQAVHPDDRQLVAAHYQRITESAEDEVHQVEYRVKSAFGTYLWFSVRERVYLRDKDNQPEVVFGICQETTARRQAEQALREAEERWQFALEGAGDGVWDWDLATDQVYFSRQWKRMLGYADDEIAGNVAAWAMLVHPDDRARVYQELDSHLQGWRPAYTSEHRLRCRDGSYKWILDRGKVIQWSPERRPLRMIGTHTDITERRQLEDALRQANEDLELRVAERTAQLSAANRALQRANQLKDEFLATVSHELRTPLTGILGITEALEMQSSGPLNDRQQHYIHTLRKSGERLLELVTSILRYTSLLAGRRTLRHESCRFAEMGAIALRKLRPHTDARRLQVEYTTDPWDLTSSCDADAVIDILTCLLDNAAKFTPEGGRIGLELRQCEDGGVQMTVWDTGVGIAPDQQEAIFASFVQGDGSLSRQYEGVGLGLAYVQRLVEALAGTITVQSAVGQGSRFTVTLPQTV